MAIARARIILVHTMIVLTYTQRRPLILRSCYRRSAGAGSESRRNRVAIILPRVFNRPMYSSSRFKASIRELVTISNRLSSANRSAQTRSMNTGVKNVVMCDATLDVSRGEHPS
jgi:hypothetical protein